MKKKIAFLALTGILVAGSAHGAAFRIPEQSINSTALSGAYIANANGPDASYFNPANMSWAEDRWQLEAELTYINLSHINYIDNTDPADDGSTTTENFILPQLHVSSKNYNDFRFGLSLTYPFGLAKRWDDTFPAESAKNFTLEVIEVNTTFAYKINDSFSMILAQNHFFCQIHHIIYRILQNLLILSQLDYLLHDIYNKTLFVFDDTLLLIIVTYFNYYKYNVTFMV